MMTCDAFRVSFEPETEDPRVLEHLRSCDACLDHAATIDPDVMFRALGGTEMIPPGGVDAFVDEVMSQIRVHEAEQKLVPVRVIRWPRRLAMAAALAAGFTGAMFMYRYDTAVAPLGHSTPIAHVARVANPVQPVNFVTKPVVETYESDKATIVEVPAESADTQIVMIFDENLPADL